MPSITGATFLGKIRHAHPIDPVARASVMDHRFPLEESRCRCFHCARRRRVRSKPLRPFLPRIFRIPAAHKKFQPRLLSRSLPLFTAALIPGGPHHSMRPHCENNFASKDCDSNVPSASYSGPSEKTFPGFAVHKKTLPFAPFEMPVICADPDFASCAYTPCPSMTSSAPFFPVPASSRPSAFNPSA